MSHCSLKQQMEALQLLHGLNGEKTAKEHDEAVPESHLRKASSKHEPRTIAERARASLLSRLVDILSQIISIERDLLASLSEDLRGFSLRHKDSVDLKNICLRMGLNGAGCQSDRDLRELRLCLQLIVDNLLSAIRGEDSLSSLQAFRRLVGISSTFTDM